MELGRIDLMQTYSFFDVEAAEAAHVAKALSRTQWGGRKVVAELADERQAPPATEKRQKPSRAERGYTKPRGKKDDWKQFFQHDQELRGPEPDFSEEGWAKRSKRKKK